jgi:hypothetical protein
VIFKLSNCLIMRSVLFLWNVLSAFSETTECQVDQNTLLQTRSNVRMATSKTAKAAVQDLRRIAESLLTDKSETREDVLEVVNAATTAIEGLEPAIRQQLENAQQQINHAAAAVQACHGTAQTQLRTRLSESVAQHAAVVEDCHNTLNQLSDAETQQCNIAEDCLCDEARVRTSDQQALCAAVTETYELAFCEHHEMCTMFHQCHANEITVYDDLRSDVTAEVAIIQQEYIAVEQGSCLTELITRALTPPITPITHEALTSCDDVDISSLEIQFPTLPDEPAPCPAHAHGDPQCSPTPAQGINNWNFADMTVNGVATTLQDGRWIHFTDAGNSGLSNLAIPGWHFAGNGGRFGLFNPPRNDVAEGYHVLFLNAGDDANYVWQDLLQPFTADIHIEAAVGGGNGNNDGGYRMGLYTQSGALVAEVAAGVNGAPNTAADGHWILTHLDVLTADHQDVVGETLQLRLKKNKSRQGHYHYIRFT